MSKTIMMRSPSPSHVIRIICITSIHYYVMLHANNTKTFICTTSTIQIVLPNQNSFHYFLLRRHNNIWTLNIWLIFLFFSDFIYFVLRLRSIKAKSEARRVQLKYIECNALAVTFHPLNPKTNNNIRLKGHTFHTKYALNNALFKFNLKVGNWK